MADSIQSECLRSFNSQVDMRLEIEPRLHKDNPTLDDKFIKRTLVFTLSATCIVDLKSLLGVQSVGYKIKSEKLCNFFC